MLIREATENDLAGIMLIERSCFVNDAWSEEVMLSELVAPHTFYVVALEGAELIGYAGLSKLGQSNQADIQTIATALNQRGKGIGRAMMQALTSKAAQLGAEEIFLEVRADNKVAQKLYEVFGLTGKTEAEKQRKKLTGLEKATFSGQTGLTSGALARDRAGAY